MTGIRRITIPRAEVQRYVVAARRAAERDAAAVAQTVPPPMARAAGEAAALVRSAGSVLGTARRYAPMFKAAARSLTALAERQHVPRTTKPRVAGPVVFALPAARRTCATGDDDPGGDPEHDEPVVLAARHIPARRFSCAPARAPPHLLLAAVSGGSPTTIKEETE